MSGQLRGVYAITDGTPLPALTAAVESAIRGGARLIQYREKSPDRERRFDEARVLLGLCKGHDVPLIVNDDVGLAAEIGADGVHLGKDDGRVEDARVRLGPRAVIGVSCYDSLERAVQAAHDGADYVAFGSFFASRSKPAAVRAPLTLLAEARRKLDIPLCAIGGITPDNGAELVAAGADMLAVIQGLFGAADVHAAAKAYSKLFT
ncbi:MAG TPA: thiamine phosphate synthase [Gammaproteobacteria bacterium]|jgi:thiamine-phosphate pyrophosphorylase|nr:thiamine phosphate synthase [Gammaproteobacteria bacterium]